MYIHICIYIYIYRWLPKSDYVSAIEIDDGFECCSDVDSDGDGCEGVVGKDFSYSSSGG
jgi:hypothetical protein